MMPDKQTFVIFARKAYEEPLAEVGSIDAGGADEAREVALSTYPDDDWVEMVAIPRRAVVPVIEDKSA